MPRYAVILSIPGMAGPGKILSTHARMNDAKAELPLLPGAYVARRKPGGAWETRDEAKARRGTTAQGGVSAVLVGGQRVNVYLDQEARTFAEWYGREHGTKLGPGHVSEGIRLALKLAKAAIEAERETPGRAGAKQKRA